MEPNTQSCNFIEPQSSKLRSLACLPLFLNGLRTLPYHDTGSSITLHSRSFRTQLPEKCKTKYSMVGKRMIKFKGIMGKQNALMAKVYRWEFGWNNSDDTVIVLSVEIPDDVINIRGMLLGRDTIYWNCWGLSYERQKWSARMYQHPKDQFTYAPQQDHGQQCTFVTLLNSVPNLSLHTKDTRKRIQTIAIW